MRWRMKGEGILGKGDVKDIAEGKVKGAEGD